MFRNILYVMLGGAVGAGLRYLVALGCSRFRLFDFPLSTFLVNITGCFLLGLLMGLSERYAHLSGAAYLMLTVGICGAFTTFSTFSADTIRLVENGQWWIAVTYLTMSVALGFILFYLGRRIFL